MAAQFELLADLLEIEGYDAFRVLAYRRAAALIRDTAGSIAQLALDGKAKQLQGIGKTIEGKIVEIDCDFSHDPTDVPRLLQAAEDADLVLGSRYVAGGGVRNWGLARRAISAGGSAYARVLLGTPVRDLTGGFKCYRREVLETIPLERISSKGYAFQIETTYRAQQAGFRVVEVPITFADREVGHSKMSRAIVLEAIWRVPALRLQALFGRL